ncbi:hypothetical protein E8E14_005094 [Neopestalotiopsis sp. 37M]|nr:hypothetical protein E8E14_005094 [Neopestalotiopsis sp. 37M]
MPHRQERRKQQERGSPYAQSLTTAIIPTRQPTADLVGQTSNPDNQVNKIKGSKMPGKLIEDAPKQSKPLQFLPPPQYPAVQCTITSQVMWGDNNYSFFSQSENLFEALRLRRHGQDRLGRKNILTRENFDSWSEMRLPEGVEPEDFLCAPPPSNHPARQVVAMDCEMVGVFAGGPEERRERSELGQVCVVDVLNGEILMNKLVLPAERVMNWRKRFSGLSYPLMLQAGKEGRLLYGWEAAREELCNYINSDTIIIGHGLENDLHMLRLAHGNIVDTSVQTAEAVFGNKERFERIWKLKDLAKALPKITIQNSRQGHDCVEDTLATREVALWAICFPEQLEAWASQMRSELEKKRIEREKKLKEQAEKKKGAEKENA